jgi:4-hydroxythreonine-4-phosphate dehydrogenase
VLTNKRPRPCIALTPGEPAGIGPDLALQMMGVSADADVVVIADAAMLNQRARLLNLARIPPRKFTATTNSTSTFQTEHIAAPYPVSPGISDPRNARYVLHTIDRAVEGCMNGEFDAMVTGPVHKSVINDAGIPFTGHTEYLAMKAGLGSPVMLLVAGDLRVALATTHIPLREVSLQITAQGLRHVISTVALSLRGTFGIVSPEIAVCGLNPHAGEGGYLGREEIDLLQPLIDELRGSGLNLHGPLPADTAFTPSARAKYDAYICMFHDQGLPVLKALGFGHAVNVTLGLPLIRTSVDHGTALDLAGSGQADPGSMRAALTLAIEFVARRHDSR